MFTRSRARTNATLPVARSRLARRLHADSMWGRGYWQSAMESLVAVQAETEHALGEVQRIKREHATLESKQHALQATLRKAAGSVQVTTHQRQVRGESWGYRVRDRSREGYTYDAKVWDWSIVQRPFSVAPGPNISDSQLVASL